MDQYLVDDGLGRRRLENFDFSINLRIKVADGHVRFTQTFVSFVNLSCIVDSFASV